VIQYVSFLSSDTVQKDNLTKDSFTVFDIGI
jgi:hypothetical protein